MEWIGRTIGQYQIVEEVGRGGMAVVYKAWQPSLRRYVALKVLPEYFCHIPEFVARFHREAQVAAQLSHPHIIPIYDIGQSDGVYFIAMEYLGGGSLTQRLAAGPLPEVWSTGMSNRPISCSRPMERPKSPILALPVPLRAPA